MSAAILFIVFNRPDVTRKTFERISQVQPKRLYIAADGPRLNCPEDRQSVREVQQIVTNIDWPCEVQTLFRDENLGCGPAVKQAIDWFFTYEEQGIILEDDCCPVISFFKYCDELLDKYSNDTRIGMIAGTNHLSYTPIGGSSYLFSKNKACWGWATWRRAWENMDFAMNWRKDSLTAKNVFKNMGVSNRYELHWNQALKAIDNNQVNAWDWQWYFSLSKQNQLCIFPATNLIENIGFGENATHTKGVAKKRYLETKELRFPLSHPSVICPDFRYDMKFEQTKMSSRRRICLQKTKALLKFIVDFISD